MLHASNPRSSTDLAFLLKRFVALMEPGWSNSLPGILDKMPAAKARPMEPQEGMPSGGYVRARQRGELTALIRVVRQDAGGY